MWQTLGYPRIVNSLDRALKQGGPGHAYLLVGPPQSGKHRLATDLAKAVNCTDPAAPCGNCRSCDRIERDLQVDIQTIGLLEEGGRRKKLIGIEQIQLLQHQASLAPFEGRYRVIMLDPAELLGKEAANCLLKTLEEPPAQVILILLATTDATLLPTIQSRCQRLDLRPLPLAEIATILEDQTDLPPERRRQIARRARGRLGWALRAAKGEDFDRQGEAALDEAAGVVYLPPIDRLSLVGQLAADFAKDRRPVLERFEVWLEWWRDLLLVELGCPDLAVNQDRLGELSRQAGSLGLAAIRQTIGALETVSQQLNANANARLAIDVLLLQIPVAGGVRR